MKQIFQVLLGGMIIMTMLFSACEKVVFPPPEIPDSVSYSLNIQPIWDAKCVSCHNETPPVPDLNPDVSYDELWDGGYIDTADAANSELMKTLYGTHDSRATESEKQTILLWMSDGAKDN